MTIIILLMLQQRSMIIKAHITKHTKPVLGEFGTEYFDEDLVRDATNEENRSDAVSQIFSEEAQKQQRKQ